MCQYLLLQLRQLIVAQLFVPFVVPSSPPYRLV